MPVNIRLVAAFGCVLATGDHFSPLLEPGGDEEIVAQGLAVDGEGVRGLGDGLYALALERRAGRSPAQYDRRHKQAQLVDLSSVEECARQARTALQENRGDPGLAELDQGGTDASGLVLAGRDDHLGSVGLERVGGRARRGARD